MTSEQRDQVCHLLESSFSALNVAVNSLSDSQWAFRPAPSVWSAAQCVEHLVEVETGVNGRIQALLLDGFSEPGLCAEAIGKERLLRRAVPSRTRRAEAPRQPANSIEFSAPNTALTVFQSVRERTLAFARTTQDEVERYVYPHFVFGQLNIYQWLLMLSLHCERHTAQIEELKANPEFPTA